MQRQSDRRVRNCPADGTKCHAAPSRRCNAVTAANRADATRATHGAALRCLARRLLWLKGRRDVLPNKHKNQEHCPMIYAQPGTPGAIVSFKARYGNFIVG